MLSEATGLYHESVVTTLREAGIFISILNPKLINDFANNLLEKVKTDKDDAVNIGRIGLDYWKETREYTETDTVCVVITILFRFSTSLS